jgi:predicted acylesterase/phospholipase RssA
LNYKALIDNPATFCVSVTDYFAQQNITLDCKKFGEQALIDFVHASASPPIFFPPVKLGNKTLVDGGLTSNYNIKDALLYDVETIVLMVPTARSTTHNIKDLFQVIGDCISIPMYMQLNEELSCINKINDIVEEFNLQSTSKYRKLNLVQIINQKAFDFGFLDFDYKGYERKDLIKYGYDIAKPILEKELCK